MADVYVPAMPGDGNNLRPIAVQQDVIIQPSFVVLK